VTQTSPKKTPTNQTTDQVKNQPTKLTNQPEKRTLRSNNKTKKNSDLASSKLNFQPVDDN
jgi:hypothetical protein